MVYPSQTAKYQDCTQLPLEIRGDHVSWIRLPHHQSALLLICALRKAPTQHERSTPTYIVSKVWLRSSCLFVDCCCCCCPVHCCRVCAGCSAPPAHRVSTCIRRLVSPIDGCLCCGTLALRCVIRENWREPDSRTRTQTKNIPVILFLAKGVSTTRAIPEHPYAFTRLSRGDAW